jgi:hypothetical protein
MHNQGQAGLLQLSAVYNCSIDMIGNTLFLPGMEFWLDPYGFGGPKFGMPQQAPLSYMPSGETIDSYNTTTEQVIRGADGIIGTDDDGTVEHVQIMAQEVKELTTPPAAETIQIKSYANVMGIGGYQLITKVSCKIAPGEYSTTIEARHVYTGYPKATNPEALYEAIKTKKINSPSAPVPDQSHFCGKLMEHIGTTDSEPLTEETVANIPTKAGE